MAITEIEIDTGLLARDTVSMDNKISRIEREMEEMFTAVRELDAMWDGPANETFVRMFQQDYETMRSFCRALHTLADCMSQARRTYENRENEAGGVVSAIRI